MLYLHYFTKTMLKLMRFLKSNNSYFVKKIKKRACFFIALYLSILSFIPSLYAYDTSAVAALVIDQKTGSVLLSKNADIKIPPASMAKLMTLNMLFEALEVGRVHLDTKFRVSAYAASRGGSTMFLRENERVSVKNLIQGVVVQSGNDACIVIAENIAGSEAVFAAQMTQRAHDLGMKQSHFVNSTGWPDPKQRMSARDLVFLANRLITVFPQYYHYFSQESFTWDDIKQNNRNPLLKLNIGADGLKTGYTQEAGYSLVGSVKQGDQRIILIVAGLGSKKEREIESEKIVNWVFREFSNYTYFKAGEKVTDAKVWLGDQDVIGLVAARDIGAVVPIAQQDQVSAEITYNDPVQTPITQGDVLATLRLHVPNMQTQVFDLLAEKDIEQAGFRARIMASVAILFHNLINMNLWAKE